MNRSHQCECAETLVKALIPAAGRGTRVAGFSNGGPKESIRVGPLSMIEHCLAMAADSGIRDIGLVIRPDKRDVALAAENFLECVRPGTARLTLIFQDPPRGVAQAMSLAQDFAGDAPLAVVMPDNLLLGGPPGLKQILDVYDRRPLTTIGALPFPADRADAFGNVGLMRLDPENPSPGRPATVVRYDAKKPGTMENPGPGYFFKGFVGVVYAPGWAQRVAALSPNHQGEIDDSDLVHGLFRDGLLQAAVLEGEGFDLGNPRGLTAARAALTGTAG